MRKLLIILFLIPLISFSQSEREDKIKIRDGQTYSSNQTTESQDKVVKRSMAQSHKKQSFDPQPIFSANNNTYRDNVDWNWRRWGAPSYGFLDYTPHFYYDRFGLRQPSRIYRMTDGEKKVVQGEKTHWRLGLSYNTNNELGGWLSVGNKTFFITEYYSNISNDKSSFLPNLTMDYVIPWNDRRLDDIIISGAIYAGAGVKFNIWGVFLAPGYGWETNNFQFFDELFILSNNGNYSFPNYTERFFTGKAGVLFDLKMISVKVDYNPFRNNLGVGAGIVF